MNRDTRLSDVLHVLLHMEQANEVLTSDVLARSMGTNPAVFRRTMAGLREAGLVRSEKGHGGGWQLSRPLREITLLDVYEALGRPNLFAIGNRSEHAECLVEKNVNAVMVDTMVEAATLFATRFGKSRLTRLRRAIQCPPACMPTDDVSGRAAVSGQQLLVVSRSPDPEPTASPLL